MQPTTPQSAECRSDKCFSAPFVENGSALQLEEFTKFRCEFKLKHF